MTIYPITSPPQSSIFFIAKKKKTQILTIIQLSNCPYFTLCDSWIFPRLEMGVKGQPFVLMEEIHQNMTAGLRAILENDFQRRFQQW
jgi:hypothetical protein